MKQKNSILMATLVIAVFALDAARSQWHGARKNNTVLKHVDTASDVQTHAEEESIEDSLGTDFPRYDKTASTSEQEQTDFDEDSESADPKVVRAPDTDAPSKDSAELIKQKRQKVIKLVERALAYIKDHDLNDALNKFTHTKDFVEGELYIYVYDDKGVCLANGQQVSELWNNEYTLTDIYGTYIVQDILNKGKQGGGWVTYNWRNATKVAYIQQIKKNDKLYTVGSGYYPHSKEDDVVNLVKGAVALFNKMKASKEPKEEAFSSLSYPMGRFVSGDLYLYALDFSGRIYAQGDRPGLIGTNSFDYKDSNGKFVNQEIINKLKTNPTEGVWVDYTSKRSLKRAYAERVVDAKGNNYFIACGFYPNEDRATVVDLVKKGYQYMKAHGKSLAAKDFTDRQNDTYRSGDLYLVVYDMNGKCIADGGNAENQNTNMWNEKNETGRYYVREIVKQGQEGGGWVDFKIRNSFQSFYVEPIDLGIDKFVIGCGVFPSSKDETVSLLVKSATSYLINNTDEAAFYAFSHVEGDVNFIRGDLSIFVVNPQGLCFVSGDDYNLIWQNILNAKDDDGKPYVKLFINTVKNGAGTVTYKINKGFKVAHVDRVEKNGTTYIIGSSYYK